MTPAAPTWRKSSHSQGGGTECVEVAQVSDKRAVRDSKDPAGPVLSLTPGAWTSLLSTIKTGAHDLP
ncbi:DUF397 domain-containing protein [Actinomadura darangshiensis]|uniref:DUF397 domain-containing protein n=1 Tax=Actinomadura darangshiensis TaxID=705336 RepID=A0A4R5BGH5_9ACTN|nr:DUF397 domain-containing protein [Actinomadura darangshiensis]TDD84785.1 DUF397 domain-containing protein [Actinomadura darangshiensis]